MKTYLILLFALCNFLCAAPNTTTVDGATSVRFYLRNYAYSLMPSNLPVLSMGLATDVNRLVYKNSSGTLYKILNDASGAANTPQGRLFYADASGSAGSSANLSFDGTRLSITGKLSLTDTLAGVNGTFSGALTGATLNTGNGANELYAMNQNVRSTDSINGLVFSGTRVRTPYLLDDSARIGKIHTIGISGITSPIAIAGLHFMNNLSTGKLTSGSNIGSIYTYNDNTALELSAGTTANFQSGIVIGARSYSGANTDGLYFYTRSTERFKVDGTGNATFNGPVASTTINTGYGDNELYAMNQNVRSTDSINGLVFNSTRTRSVEGFYTGGVNASDIRSSDSVKGTTGAFTSIHTRFSIVVDSGGISTGASAQNRQWHITGHAVNTSTGKNQFLIERPNSTIRPFRIDSLCYDSTLVITSDTVKTKKIKNAGVIDTDTLKSKKQIVLNTLGTLNISGFNTINVDTLSTTNINIVTSASTQVQLIGTVGTVVYVRCLSGYGFTLITNSITGGGSNVVPGEYYQYIIAEDNRVLAFKGL